MLIGLMCLGLLLGLCCAAAADEEPILGMGRRDFRGDGRLDIEYSADPPTPHIDWADPLASGPIHAFAVPSVAEGRTLVELMQRLSLEVDAVTIDPAWDVNKWTMSFGDAYGARSEQNADGTIDYSLVYRYLEEDLTGDRNWDVMIMHGILGWGHPPERVRQAIARRVREGMGLVIVGPFAGPGAEDELSALSPLVMEGAPGPRPSGASALPGEWRAPRSHYVTNGVPLETLPADYLRHRLCEIGRGATVLATAGGDPAAAAWEVGGGRVVAFGYDSYGLAPYIGWDAYGEVGDGWWETWYSLFIRAVVWAARREPEKPIGAPVLSDAAVSSSRRDPVAARVRLPGHAEGDILWQVRDDSGTVVCSGQARRSQRVAEFEIPVAELHGGAHVVDVFLVSDGARLDWGSAALTVRPTVRVAEVGLRPTVVEAGKPVRATISLRRALPRDCSLVLELVDNYQRVIARAVEPHLSENRKRASATLTAGDALTHIGWVRAAVLRGERVLDRAQIRVAIATPPERRAWDDFEVNIPFYGPNNPYHWMPLLDEQFRRAGVTWLMEPERNFRFTVLARPSGLGVYHYDRKPFEEQMEAYWLTGERRYLQRDPCLHGAWSERARHQIARQVRPYLKYRPFHYYIYDEPSLTSYSRAFDFCYSPETLEAFREWLRREYGALAALNETWGTSYRRWAQVEPPTTKEAQREGPVAAWADFRRFMDITFAEALRHTWDVVDDLDPGGLTLIGGTQVPTPFNGTDYWLFSQTIGVLEPYFGIEQFRSFNPDLPIIQACGYGSAGKQLENELWRWALQGQKGATIFWNYTFHDPDLALNSQGEAMAAAFGALRGKGIAKLLFGARRDDSRIAILYSQMSLYAAWIQDGDIRTGRSAEAERWRTAQRGWERALHDLGLHYRWVSYEQLGSGAVTREDFDALVLPRALALSDDEAEAVRRFAEEGGLVLADGDPGRFDGHCVQRRTRRWAAGIRSTDPSLDNVRSFAAAVRKWAGPLLERAGVRPAARVEGASPHIVRYVDGEAEYIGVVGALEERHSLDFGRSTHVYDVRGRCYLGERDSVELGGGQDTVWLYALLPGAVHAVQVETPRELRPGEELRYTVAMPAGGPAVRRIAAVKVYGPDGRERPMYGDNVEVTDGRANGGFHLALNDPAGQWRVVAEDAASGLGGEVRFLVPVGGG